jgi:hypothetical protein
MSTLFSTLLSSHPCSLRTSALFSLLFDSHTCSVSIFALSMLPLSSHHSTLLISVLTSIFISDFHSAVTSNFLCAISSALISAFTFSAPLYPDSCSHLYYELIFRSCPSSLISANFSPTLPSGFTYPRSSFTYALFSALLPALVSRLTSAAPSALTLFLSLCSHLFLRL